MSHGALPPEPLPGVKWGGQKERINMDVSIVVSPRERFSSIVGTLAEIVASVPTDIEIIVAEGGTPETVRNEIRKIASARRINWISVAHPLTPNASRNIGFEQSHSKYVVFVDNDITFEIGWLEALVGRAEADEADVVAPLICIGPPRAKVIHHAGGTLHLDSKNSNLIVVEKHRLMDVPIEQFSPEMAPPENEVGEFHCILVRRTLLEKIGPLDERLITREQMDFALRCKTVDAVVRFEKDAIVTYEAREKFTDEDLRYHLFRWSDDLAVRSMDAFESSWGIRLDRERIRYKWIAKHRRNAYKSAYHASKRLFGPSQKRIEASVRPWVELSLDQSRFPPNPKIDAEDLLS